ncbi:hypothetical protein O3P69_019171 [Scylla paramamosain]|uniref:Uncharacterized protein n=1 Tax=Scylla paramamosain TaxID=85552 RepID=A0AAW0SWM9_SCYPA
MLCRLKQLEAERDMLVQGCEVVERARVWYREQLATTTDRIYSLPHATHKMGPPLVSARQQEEQRLVTKLKEQNHQLTEEVSNKSERIAILEREKAALLRELFQPRPCRPPCPCTTPSGPPTATTTTATADSTFM